MRSKLTRLVLKVQDFSSLDDFYCGLLGMQRFGTDTKPLYGYDQASSQLAFHDGAAHPYSPSSHDLYWKLGITLRDLDHAVAYLRQRNYEVSDPEQFRDIGYMSHLRDPKGFTIELLQQRFEGGAQKVRSGHPIGAQATLAHTTLRTADLSSVRRFCEEELGMHLVSVQPVTDLNFCLYFFTWGDEQPPMANLEAVENREWLWSRPDMLLEFQHLISPTGPISQVNPDASGFHSLAYEQSGTLQYLTPEQLPSTAIE